MGKKLYVGNLSYDVDNASLEALFATYGTVNSAEVIHDRDTGRSKGFGFVEMADDNACAGSDSWFERNAAKRPATHGQRSPPEGT